MLACLAGLSRRSKAQADAQIFSRTGERFFQRRRGFSSCEMREKEIDIP
jgi:hypothetical protein